MAGLNSLVALWIGAAADVGSATQDARSFSAGLIDST
jgi:hypothetical protein